MKKILRTLVATMALALGVAGFAACDHNDAIGNLKCVHLGGTATCTEQAICVYCGEFYGEALGHDYTVEVTAPTCTEEGYSTYDCNRCGEHKVQDTVVANGHDHDAVVTAPDCTNGGYTTYTCHCGDTYVANEVPANGHDYTTVVTAPTCTTSGYTTYTCHCGDTYVADEVDALGHDYEAVVTAPTCTTSGYTTYTCHCGDTYVGDQVSVIPHVYNAENTAPTCTEQGYTTYTCHCGDTYVADEVPATGHSHEAEVTAPNCTEQGYTTHTCHCGDEYVDTYVDALGHDYDHIVTDPTCTEEGYTEHICARCDYSYEDSAVPAYGHKDTTVDGQCDNEDCDKYICPKVGEAFKLRMDVVTLNKTLYFSGAMSGYYFATTTDINQGVDLFLEEADGSFYIYFMNGTTKNYLYVEASGTYNNPKFGTTKGVWAWDDALGVFTTTTSNGTVYLGTYKNENKGTTYETISASYISFISGTNASKVGETQFPARAVTFTNHTHDNNSVVTDPTCTADGYTTNTCKVCGIKEKVEPTTKLGHSYGEPVVTAPTCEAEGYSTHTCTVCGSSYKDAEVEKLGHKLTLSETVDPTCTEDGYFIMVCAHGCGKAMEMSDPDSPAKGHTYVEGVCHCGVQDPDYVAHVHNYTAEVTEATCTTAGFTTYTCACEDTYTADPVDALGHVDADLDHACDRDGCAVFQGVCEDADGDELCDYGCGKEYKKEAPVTVADFSKFAANTSYSTYNSNGWKTTNCAIFQGGSSDSAPTFKCIGSTSASKAVCLNGKTVAKGTLTSPTLTGGLSKLTFNYANVYSESKGVDITITIKDANGNVVATKKLDNDSVTQYKAYEFVWELEAPIEGDYVIVISNNSPSNNSSKNKDRVSIWNITMTGYLG